MNEENKTTFVLLEQAYHTIEQEANEILRLERIILDMQVQLKKLEHSNDQYQRRNQELDETNQKLNKLAQRGGDKTNDRRPEAHP